MGQWDDYSQCMGKKQMFQTTKYDLGVSVSKSLDPQAVLIKVLV